MPSVGTAADLGHWVCQAAKGTAGSGEPELTPRASITSQLVPPVSSVDAGPERLEATVTGEQRHAGKVGLI